MEQARYGQEINDIKVAANAQIRGTEAQPL
jgi:hypothetical protein